MIELMPTVELAASEHTGDYLIDMSSSNLFAWSQECLFYQTNPNVNKGKEYSTLCTSEPSYLSYSYPTDWTKYNVTFTGNFSDVWVSGY